MAFWKNRARPSENGLLSRPLFISISMTAAISVFFYLAPGIDIAFTHLFHQPGPGFPAARAELLQDFRNFGSNLAVALPLVLAVALALKLTFPSKPSLLPPRLSLFFVTLFLSGPVLLVNGLLKPFWGRPRPVNVEEFGGIWPFLPAWMVGPDGLGNHSFSSGEAASAACLLPLILFLPREWRWPVGALLGAFVAAVGLNRIAFGAHFLSDVVISVALMLVLAAVLHHLFFVRFRETFSDAALEEWLTVLGNRMAADRAAFNRRLVERLVRGRSALAGFISARRTALRLGRPPAETQAAAIPLARPAHRPQGGAAIGLGHAAPNDL